MLQVSKRFEDLKKELMPDKRQGVFNLEILAGVIEGVAEQRFEKTIYDFANENNIALKANFITPQKRYLMSARAFMKAGPSQDSDNVSELKYGDEVEIYDSAGDFARAKSTHDGYFGWLDARDIVHSLNKPTHQVKVLRAHVYSEPRVNAMQIFELSYAVKLAVKEIEGDWAKVIYAKNSEGFVRKSILGGIGDVLEPGATSIIEFAHKFLESPYTWGGVTAWGLDCSGFSQTVFAAHGISLPRDANQQSELGKEISLESVQAADLLFFDGHVVIAIDNSSFIHANANGIRVTTDNFNSVYGQWLKKRFIIAKRIL